MKYVNYLVATALCTQLCTISLLFSQRWGIPRFPFLAKKESLSNAIARLESKTLVLAPELFNEGLEVKADMLELDAQELQAAANNMPDAEESDAKEYSQAARLIQQLNRKLKLLPVATGGIKISGNLLRPWITVLSEFMKLTADHFTALDQQDIKPSKSLTSSSLADIAKEFKTLADKLNKHDTASRLKDEL